MEYENIGIKKCVKIIEALKEKNLEVFKEKDLKLIIMGIVGLNKLTILRYTNYLIMLNMIEKLENGNYRIIKK